MRRSYPVALGGVLAALAVVIMTLGGLIPFATYVCPMLCGLLLFVVTRLCGERIGWAWYGAVCVLSLLLGPDKEASGVFVVLGYYPIIQPKLEKLPMQWLWKVLIFNGASVILYAALLYLFGMDQLMAEFREMGMIGLLVTLILGNVCFFMLDRVLHILPRKFHKK